MGIKYQFPFLFTVDPVYRPAKGPAVASVHLLGREQLDSPLSHCVTKPVVEMEDVADAWR